MKEDDQINRRKEVLDRFRESLRLPVMDRYYDEDELLEVLDFAGDVNDEYLRSEALLMGARLYPDSQEILERKAVFYSQRSDIIFENFLEDNSAQEGMIFDLLRAQLLINTDPAKALAELDRIALEYTDYTDEETIQLIALASDLGATEWLHKNFKMLRSRAGYLNILLYEMSVATAVNGDYAFSVQLLEELTELEPYNPYFWLMLSREYTVGMMYEKALSAVDYALAIDPEDPAALMHKAQLLSMDQKNSDEILHLLEHAYKIDPEAIDVSTALAACYKTLGDVARARKIIEDAIDRHPGEYMSLLPILISYEPDNIDDLLDRLYSGQDDNNEIYWIAWAKSLRSGGLDNVADKVIEAFMRNSHSDLLSFDKFMMLYRRKNYDELAQSVKKFNEAHTPNDPDFMTSQLLRLMALLKTGKFDEARCCCIDIEGWYQERMDYTLSASLQIEGLRDFAHKVIDKLNENMPLDYWRRYDPYLLG